MASDFDATRAKFALPEGVVYLDGNSLGPLPRSAMARMAQVMETEWGEWLISGWNRAGWMAQPGRIGDAIGRLVGAPAGTVTVGDTLTVKIFQALDAALQLNPGRSVILSDRTLREQLAAGRIVIDPLDESLIQPSSIDVRISNLFRVFRNHTRGVIDVKHDMDDLTELIEIPVDTGDPFILHPGEFVLGSTHERIADPDDLVGRVEGKSSLGRLGLLIHSTAGFIDAGFDGHITLELANVASLPITLYPHMKIGQVSFMQMTTAADRPYGSGAEGSKYQGQRGPTPSRYFENFDR